MPAKGSRNARIERELAEREESYRVLAETAPDGIITVDRAGTIPFVNTTAARMFGYTCEELTEPMWLC